MPIPRRTAIAAMSAAMSAAGLLGLAGCTRIPAAPGQNATADFISLSRRLTGYVDLDVGLAGRIEAAVRQQHGADDGALRALNHAVMAAGPSFALPALPADVRALATLILRAWQIGVVGEGDRAQVVSYEDTLMYRPIADVCVLPTYARGEPHYWAHPLPARVPA